MNAHAPAQAGPETVLGAVIATVAAAARLDPDRLAAAPDADLLVDVGLDSLQLLQIWVELEKILGIPDGMLGGAQATTIAAIAREAAALAPPPSSPVPPAPVLPAPILDAEGIEALIPHRAPIRLIDAVTDLEPGRRGTGIRDFPAGDPRFDGHFPGDPILPGIFVVEACAQLVGLVAASAAEPAGEGRAAIEYLASIERFKFLATVRPGDRLTLRAELGRRAGGLLQARVSASAGNRPVAEGTLLVTAHAQPRKGP